MSVFTYVSLFSGIGGFETALNRLGGTCLLAIDNDDYVATGYEKLHGDLLQSDIHLVPSYAIPTHDLLVASFPNEPYAVAWKRKGLEDTRSDAFNEISRIAESKQPKVILLENVKGLLTLKSGAVFVELMKQLTEAGYAIDFNLLNALDSDIPQNRERLFIVAVRNDLLQKEFPTFTSKSSTVKKAKLLAYEHAVKLFNLQWETIQPEDDDNEIPSLLQFLDTVVEKKRFKKKEVVERFIPATHATPENSGELRFAGGIAQASYWNDSPIVTSSKFGIGNRVYDARGIASFIPSQSVGGYGGQTSLYLIPIRKPKESRNTKLDRVKIMVGGKESIVWVPKVTKEGTDKWKVTYQENSNDYILRALTPSECFKLQGFPQDTYNQLDHTDLSMTRLYKHAGNATNVAMVETLFPLIKPYL